MESLRLVVHCEQKKYHGAITAALNKIVPQAQVMRDWDRVLSRIDDEAGQAIDIVMDLVGQDGMAGLAHLRELWELRAAHNYSPTPIYFALSVARQPASFRYEIRRLGGLFIYASDIPRHLADALEEIQIQLAETKSSMPRWEVIEERFGADSRRVHVALWCGHKPIFMGGSDRHCAALSVFIRNNGVARSMRALRELCAENPLFAPSGGPFSVPQLGTLKMWLYRDFPRCFQRAFDEARSGFRAEQVIEHVDLDAKAIGFRIRGRSRVTVR